MDETEGFYTYTSKKTGRTYVLNSRFFNNHTFYFFSKEPKNPVEELPRGYMVVEAKNGVPLVASET